MQQEDIPEITPELLQQNPVLALFLVFFAGVFFLVSAGSLVSWGWILYRWASGLSVLPLELPWKPRVWSLADVVIIGFLVGFLQVLLTSVTYQLLGVQRGEEPPMEAMAAGGLASLLAVLLGAGWIVARYRQTISHIGFGPIPWRLMVGGLVVGLAALPVVYLMMMVVNLLFSSEYEHPLIDSAVESGSMTGYFMGVFAAVIAAPIVEEFGFRVILQGWLQSVPFKPLGQTLMGTTPSVAEGSQVKGDDGEVDISQREAFPSNDSTGKSSSSGDKQFPPDQDGFLSAYQPPNAAGVSVDPPRIQETVNQDNCVPPIWPSVVVGILFGLAHYQYGLSFLPLSALGILLGLVYRQTHSVWPCILIHMMLNGFSMMSLGLVILIKQATG